MTARGDEELVAAFVAGDEAAFSELVGRYERRVFGICYRYFGDPTDAEDAAQEVFLTLYRRASTFQGGARLSTWLYRVAVNACNDIARRRSRRPRSADVEITDLPLAAEDELGHHELRMELHEALAALEPEYREAVVAHTVHGWPYADIAAAQGVAVGTVKSRVHRGHAKLAIVLARMRDDPPREPSGRAPPPT